MKKRNTTILFLTLILLFGTKLGYSKTFDIDPPTNKTLVTIAPSIILSGNLNLSYCPQTDLNIIENVNLSDPDNQIKEIFIQISTNYVSGLDQLKLANPSSHPKIKVDIFDINTGRIRIYKADATTTLNDFESALEDIQFRNDSPISSGTRNFSITLGQVNYLPRNKHFYRYIAFPGITWTKAKEEAETTKNEYYGLKGYLATLTADDEAQLAGAQASGAGWIGGSDKETEGVWKWVTGPEAGTIMTYTNWNSGEPNDYGDGVGSENYAHITTPGMINSTKGSWNDLPDTGDTNPTSAYHPLGYIIEYGGMIPGDVDSIQISASTTLTIAKITTVTTDSRCDPGSITLKATASIGTIEWYEDVLGGSIIHSGNDYTNTNLASTKNYYAEVAGCPVTRTVITATINTTPSISTTKPTVSRCGTGTIVIEAIASVGNVNWFTDAAVGTQIGTGTTFTTPALLNNTLFYAEANNNGCLSNNRQAINAIINPIPVVNNETLILCQSSSITIDATLSGMTYLWSTSETSKTITVTSAGNYDVIITNSHLCSSTKTIAVVEHLIPEIDSIKVEETNVEIIPKNQKSYFEYSIDGFNYQNSNVFLNAPGGLQTAYAREMNGCGTDSEDFVVLLAPAFFTPNNDSFNDFWTVKGILFYPNAELRIFDRYGKLLKELRPTSLGWDGTFNGQELPSSDYWYVFKMDATTPEKKGHFTLKR
jgi:gliding motility-associated-like protein